jgi:molybdopterin converting factor small subunit
MTQERIFEVDRDEVEEALEEVRASLGERRYEVLRNLFDAYDYVTGLIRDKVTSIKKLRKILFGSSSEKSKNVLRGMDEEEQTAGTPGGYRVKSRLDGVSPGITGTCGAD